MTVPHTLPEMTPADIMLTQIMIIVKQPSRIGWIENAEAVYADKAYSPYDGTYKKQNLCRYPLPI